MEIVLAKDKETRYTWRFKEDKEDRISSFSPTVR